MTKRWAVLTMAILTMPGCTGASEPPAPSRGSAPASPPLPAACELVTPADVERALRVAVRRKGPSGPRDRCRYASDGADEVEITVDSPGREGVVGAYRALNRNAEQVDGIGEEGALSTAAGTGELVFIKNRTRFFVVVASPAASRDALLILGRAAAERM